ncbi:hypothetical protein HG536_0H02370 [Torulaspora globosa]|uniref:Uncharacterized protein n=1 Tax=Torulaspora globosa TaxID=48254 RepID=A0A7G3ZMX6_9SACH|nr:uncharacterized protein HG536_0H02370 [Torulaspora globosa]QLL34862.1 hypothetical protein HG536_0H02370 [Torulaspora globosa]
MSVSASKSRHVKFGDEDSDEVTKVVETRQTGMGQVSDSSDSEDDEAPQEEGLASGMTKVEEQFKQREEALRREKQVLKEKRRKADAKFKEQQLTKGNRAKSGSLQPDEESPEELPEDFFDKLEQEEAEKPIEQMPKHINFNEISDRQYTAEVKKQLEKKKQKTLKKLRANTVKRGSFNVSLLSHQDSMSSMAPKKEASIMNSKDKWLRRKSIRRK